MAVLKLKQKLRPLLYWAHYAAGRLPRTGQSDLQAFRAFGAVIREAFQVASQGHPERNVRAAERLQLAKSDYFPILGYGNLAKPKGPEWHRDMKHGYSWPARYFVFCDFVAPDVRADVKIPWEMSRLQWLVWLAEGSLVLQESDRHEIKSRMITTLEDWVGANPVGYGINWACGMEVAIRATNVAIAVAAISHFMDDSEVTRVCSILRSHLLFLGRFLEESDLPGNHYLADLMGEVVLHAALNGLQSDEFEKALSRFANAADAQFEPDGCHIERATIYHRLAYDMAALPYALALRADSPTASLLAGTLSRAGSFMAQIADSNGNLPVFGDQDSGFVLWFGEAAQHADLRICKASAGPETDLYSFLAALAHSGLFFPGEPRTCGTRSGFATVADDNFHAVLKSGPIGLEGRAAHDHDDALSVCVSYMGLPLIVDPGCHSYTLSPKLRLEAIVSSRHNAPTPAERERHPPSAGSINATMRGAPTAQLQAWSPIETCGVLSRTPVSRMAAARTLRVSEKTLEINDCWRFDSPEAARTFWLFDPSWRFENAIEWRPIAEDPALVLFNRSNERLHLCIEAPASAHLRCFPHYFSPDYGAFIDCWALEIVAQASLESRMSIRLSGQA